MIRIFTKNNKKIILCQESAKTYLSQKWYIGTRNKKDYLVRFDGRKCTYFHTFIIGKREGFVIDHISGNSLDNRIENLRHCTIQENLQNSRAKKGKYKGVHEVKRKGRKPFYAQIRKDGKTYNLGAFNCQEEAAAAYDKKAIELFGKFAYLNFSLTE